MAIRIIGGKRMRKRTAIVGLVLVIILFVQIVDLNMRTSAQAPLTDDDPELHGVPVPDDYEFEVLASNHTVIGIRPSSGDNFDLEVYTNTTFTSLIDSSTVGGSSVDFVILNGTEWASPPNRSARVVLGSTSYVIEMENDIPARSLSFPWNGTIESNVNVSEVFDAFELTDMTLGKVYTIYLVVPASADLNMFILNATGDRSDAIALSANAGAGVNESTSFTANTTDDIVLVVTNENNGTGNYTIFSNLAPVVNVSADQTIDEGKTAYMFGNFTDEDMCDNYSYVWDFGDGAGETGTIVCSGNLLVNGDFSNGLTGWNLSIEVPATTTIKVVPQDGTHFNVLDINNPINDADGDWDWAYQELWLNVSNYSKLYFEADGKAIYQSLSDDGFVGGEYPVHFAFRYMDINGIWHNGLWTDNPWQTGFYYLGTGSEPYSNKVSQNVWFHYKSDNLMELSPKPMVISNVRVGSSGWAYHGMIDNVKLYSPFNTSEPISASHTYGDNGIFNVTLTVIDIDGGSDVDTLTVTVNNVAPDIDTPSPLTINEGESAVFDAHSTDPGSDDLTFTWDWGHSDLANTIFTNLSNPPSQDPYPSTEINPRDVLDFGSQIYGDNGMFNITLTVNDDDTGMNITTTNVTVNNLAPSGNLNGPDSGYINQPVDFTGNATDPGSDDLIFTWNWGDGSSDTVNTHFNDGIASDLDPSPTGTFPFTILDSVQHTYGGKGTYAITLTISDDDGDSVTYNKTINITSAPPVISNVQATPDPQIIGSLVTISAEVTDTDTDIGDITVTVVITDPEGTLLGNHTMSCDSSGTCTYSSNFDLEGQYSLVIWAIDDDDNWDSATGTFDMESQPEEPVVYNWKPIIAIVFAIILLLLGMLASYNRPIRFKGILRRDRAFTFLIGSLPFVIAEIITGLVSLFTGLLPVPPWFGLGMIVDLVILIVGILVCIIILVKGKKPDSYDEEGSITESETAVKNEDPEIAEPPTEP